MSSSFPVVNHDVIVPVLPFQFGKLKSLGSDLVKKILPPDQFCHELGGYPLLIRVLSADVDLVPLYGGVWGAKLHCNVVVFRPTPRMTVEGQCWDARNKVFSYLDLSIQILKPDGTNDDSWQGSKVENGDTAKLVLLGYGNCKTLTDFTPGTDNLRFQTNNFKPVPILYARFEDDPPSGYTIPHGGFKPKNEPKASRHFTEEEVMKFLGKAFKPSQLNPTEEKTVPKVTAIEKTKMQESLLRKRSRSVAIMEEFSVPTLRKRRGGNTEIELQNGRSQTNINVKKSTVSLAKPSQKNIFDELCDLDNSEDFCLSNINESPRGFDEPEQKRQKTKQVKEESDLVESAQKLQVKEECDLVGSDHNLQIKEECDVVESEIIELLLKKKKKKRKADKSGCALVDNLALDDSGVEMDLDKEKKKKRKSIL